MTAAKQDKPSDTPRTDAERLTLDIHPSADLAYKQMCTHAEQLERALARYEQAELSDEPLWMTQLIADLPESTEGTIRNYVDAHRFYAAKVRVELDNLKAKIADVEKQWHESNRLHGERENDLKAELAATGGHWRARGTC